MSELERATFKKAFEEIDRLLFQGYEKRGELLHIPGNAWFVQHLELKRKNKIILVSWNVTAGIVCLKDNQKIIKEWRYEEVY